MSEFENLEAMELNEKELNEIAGGAFKPLPDKPGFIIYQISKGETLDGWTEVSLDDMPGRPGHNPHVRYWTGRPGKELMGKVKWG